MRALLLSLSAFQDRRTPTISKDGYRRRGARTLAERTLPCRREVFEAMKGAIVRVRTAADALESDEYLHRPTGTGVVMVNRGTILTSLHVVAGAGRIRVVFADGLESDATVVAQHPENDLAVLQAADPSRRPRGRDPAARGRPAVRR